MQGLTVFIPSARGTELETRVPKLKLFAKYFASETGHNKSPDKIRIRITELQLDFYLGVVEAVHT